MPDGVRLSARIWMPVGSLGQYPAILEYIPYRKRDLVRARDERNHPFLAANGYACLRVDMRGSGDSEGIMTDMYSSNELEDAVHVINWISSQSWCNGRVGMFGTSWGGTASLQAAVDAPESLKAVLANCATWDRFEDDIHWMGGCLLTDSLEWGATLPAILAVPPDLATIGEDWKRKWIERLESLSFPVEAWLRNGVRGAYWRNGSVRFDCRNLSCPILTVGGWSDRYSNSVMQLVKARPDICWGIVGPWGHHYPDQGEPGPAIGFQKLALEWWNHWLKSDAPGKLSWPRLRLWKRKFDLPRKRLDFRNGNWIETDIVEAEEKCSRYLHDGRLAKRQPKEGKWLRLPFDVRHGECAGDTGYFGRLDGLPLDQSTDDLRSVCFETEPLNEAIVLVGSVKLKVKVRRKRAPAQLVCRLCEVNPDNVSNLVVRGILNLELDEALEKSRPHRDGEAVEYCMLMPATAYHMAQGNRIRLALSASLWPIVWPTPQDPQIHVLDGGVLEIPNMQSRPIRESSELPAAEAIPKRPRWRSLADQEPSRIRHESEDGVIRTGWKQPATTISFHDLSLAVGSRTGADYRIEPGNPGNASCNFDHEIRVSREDGIAEVISCLEARGDGRVVRLNGAVIGKWNDAELARKEWQLEVSL